MKPTDNKLDPTLDSSLALSPQAAAMFCLLAVAQADGPICARELELIARLVDTPETKDTTSLALARDLLGADDGLESGLVLVCAALDRVRCAQAYALAADFVMLNAQITPEEIRLLDILAENFRLNPLTRAAIDTAAQIRLAPDLKNYD